MLKKKAFLEPSEELKNDPQAPEKVCPDIASILAPKENPLIFRTYLLSFSPLVHVLILRSFDIVRQTYTV